MGQIRVLTSGGDETIEWDPADDESSQAAHRQFDELKEKGYRAYELVASRGRQVEEFDRSLGKVLMAPVAAPVAGGGPVSSAPVRL